MLTKVTADCLPRDLHVAPMGSAFVVYTLEGMVPGDYATVVEDQQNALMMLNEYILKVTIS